MKGYEDGRYMRTNVTELNTTDAIVDLLKKAIAARKENTASLATRTGLERKRFKTHAFRQYTINCRRNDETGRSS